MNILEITGSSAHGGGPEHLLHLISQLKACNLYLASPCTEPYYSKFRKIMSKNIFQIPERKFSIIRAILLIKFSYQMKIDIVHTHGKAASLYGRFLKLFLSIRLVHTPHGIHFKNYSPTMARFYFCFERATKKLNDFIIYVSQSEEVVAKNVNLWGGIKSRVIPNGVANHDYVDLSIKEKIRKKYSISISDVVVVSICRLNFQKNYLEICEIAKQLPSIRFIIFGDGEGRSKIEQKLINENICNVTLAGFVENAKDELFAFDIYLSTSLWEGMPLAVLEAMSHGLPILASNVPGNYDVVGHNKNGFLYELGDIKQASAYIYKLSQNSSLRSNMGIRGRDNQRNHFSSDRMVSDVFHIYESLTKS